MKVPTYTLRADDPDAFDALCLLGSLKQKQSKERDQVLDACLEFSVWRDQHNVTSKPMTMMVGMGSDPAQMEAHGNG